MPEPSIFDPAGLEDVRATLQRAEASECRCGDSNHENIIHDLVFTDVPWLLAKVADAWDEGYGAGRDDEAELEPERSNPYRDHA
jgi:hypothetical protein